MPANSRWDLIHGLKGQLVLQRFGLDSVGGGNIMKKMNGRGPGRRWL